MREHEFDRDEDEALTTAARSLHEEWDSPRLWPQIAAALERERRASGVHSARPPMFARPIVRFAAAVVVVLAAATTTWILWRSSSDPRHRQTGPAPAESSASKPLLTDDAVAEIDRAEAQYVRAIDELTRLTKPKLDMPDSPLVVNLRERLKTIDTAIDEYRKQIESNRFNAHLRQQLLWIYQEKRRTLEEVQETDRHAS